MTAWEPTLQRPCYPSRSEKGALAVFELTIMPSFLYFYFYTMFRTIFVRRKMAPLASARVKGKTVPTILSVPEELGIGFVAGVLSRAISTPLSVVTVRLQTTTEGEDEENELNAEKGSPAEAQKKNVPRGVASTVKRIYDEQGLAGFWGGEHHAVIIVVGGWVGMRLSR